MQRRDVGEADERLRSARERGVVERVEEAHRAVAAARAPDRVDLRIAQRAIEVAQSFLVAAGEVAAARQNVRRDDGLPSHRLHVADRALEIGWSAQRSRG